MSRTLISLVLLAASTAAAEPAAELDSTIAHYKDRIDYLKTYWSSGLDSRWPADGCHAALEAGRASGVTIAAEQTQVCDQFRAYHQLAEAEKAVSDAYGWIQFVGFLDAADHNGENGAKMTASAATCTSEMDRLLAAGMPTDVTVRIGNNNPLNIPMSEAKEKVCNRLATVAHSFAENVSAAKGARLAKIAAPYKAAGITGDRLDLLVDHVDYAMYGVGGAKLRTPQQLKAKVIFELLGPGTDGLYILRRYQFAGDKLVSTTKQEFLLHPGAKYFR